MSEKVKLGDVCKVQGGYAFKSKQFQKNKIPIVRIGNIQDNQVEIDYSVCYTEEFLNMHPEFEIQDGDILIAMSGATVGKIGKYKNDKKALLNQRVGNFITTEKLEKGYLYFLLQSPLFEKYILNNAFGCAQPNISSKKIEEFEFYLYDNKEQMEITNQLDKIQKIVDIRKKQIEQLDELIKSQFVEMFGDPFLNEKSWKTNTIGECCTLKSGTSLPAEVENEGGDVLYIKVGDMNLIGNEKNITTSNHRVTEKTAGKGIFELGTILFPKRGGAIGTNKKRLTVSKVCADLNVMGVTPTSKLLSEYLYTYFLFIDLGSLNNGSSVPQINNKDIEPLIIPLPPIECQNQFADFVKGIDKQKFEIQKSLEEMQLLQESLMNKYFGEM